MERVLIKQRDRFTLELKARYLEPSEAVHRADYKLGVFFFFPPSFAVSAQTFDPSELYDEVRQHVRFNTPVFTPEELLRDDSPTSPLRRVERDAAHVDDDAPERIGYESRLLGAVLKTILRNMLLEVQKAVAEGDWSDRLVAECRRTIAGCREVVERFHRVTRRLTAGTARDDRRLESRGGEQLPRDRQSRLVDEHLSLLLERYLASLLSAVGERAFGDVPSLAVETLRAEEEYRRDMGYRSVPSELSDERELEEYVYREKMLKKYASEVLYCDVRRRNVARAVEHLLYGLAAGLAMVVATGIAFFGQTRFGGLTTSLFWLLVAGYIVKDRVKDIFRDLFRRRIGRRFSDRTSTVRDRGKKIATLSERTAFVDEDQLPERIRELRGRGYFERTIHRFEQEAILRYRRHARLRARALATVHRRVEGLADIIVFDVAPFVAGLGQHYGLIPVTREPAGADPKQVRRIYHLNVVVSFTDDTGTYARRLRLIVDAEGIHRVEEPAGHSDHDEEAIRFVGRGATTGDPDLDDPDRDY